MTTRKRKHETKETCGCGCHKAFGDIPDLCCGVCRAWHQNREPTEDEKLIIDLFKQVKEDDGESVDEQEEEEADEDEIKEAPKKRKKYRRVPEYYASRAHAREGSHPKMKVRANWCRSKQCYVYYPDQNGEKLKRAPRTPQRAAVRKQIKKYLSESVDNLSDMEILGLVNGPKPRYCTFEILPTDETGRDRILFSPGVLFENGSD